MLKETITPVVRLIRGAYTLLRDGKITPACAFAITRFAAEDIDGELYLPRPRFLGYEDYWFDIPGYVSAFLPPIE